MRSGNDSDRETHPSHDPEPDGVRLYPGGQACRRCCHFVAFEGATPRITDVGVAPCQPARIALREQADG